MANSTTQRVDIPLVSNQTLIENLSMTNKEFSG